MANDDVADDNWWVPLMWGATAIGAATTLLKMFRRPRLAERLGVWWDDPESYTRGRPAMIRTMLDAGFTDYCVFLADHEQALSGNFFENWSVDGIRWFAGLLPRNRRLHITTWIAPNKAHIDALLDALEPVAQLLDSVEPDLEPGPWQRKYVVGFDSIEDAGDYLVTEIRRRLRCRVGVTSLVSDGRSYMLRLYRQADYVTVQTYTGRMDHKDPEYINPASRLFPGKLQPFGAARYRRYGARQIVLGQAAYRQGIPTAGLSAWDTLRMAQEASRGFELRYWSSKWLVGHQSNNNGDVLAYFQHQNQTEQRVS